MTTHYVKICIGKLYLRRKSESKIQKAGQKDKAGL